ncbi:antibiotic biosynthesis monooxygenase family protein [Streptomyces sp. NPDC048172]|uniref:antibiotic biosynthesis monooxygenase family protein n=1 Tax=Streptomyces sp. NPDC048172 TaxID=3365505 RepID=UPI0037218C7A
MTEPGVRILFHATVEEGREAAFLDAYEHVRKRVAEAEGHLGEELCQSLTEPGEWLITSAWASEEHYRAWAREDGHQDLAAPIVATTLTRADKPYAVRVRTA